MSSVSFSKVENLGDDIISQIIQYLDLFNDLYSLAQVSKFWKFAAAQFANISKISLNQVSWLTNLQIRFFKLLSKSCPRAVEHLELSNCVCEKYWVQQLFAVCRSYRLKNIQIENCAKLLEDQIFKLMMEHKESIEMFEWIEPDKANRGFDLINSGVFGSENRNLFENVNVFSFPELKRSNGSLSAFTNSSLIFLDLRSMCFTTQELLFLENSLKTLEYLAIQISASDIFEPVFHFPEFENLRDLQLGLTLFEFCTLMLNIPVLEYLEIPQSARIQLSPSTNPKINRISTSVQSLVLYQSPANLN
jgi:hypothetical protein